ncbi:hypothetical protein [Methylobacterium sp. J-068]|uniref:hypothetical protein n=1 Tax=Methylobacterium sp. J-068 TaxID=2836649 RepID=UPI001FB9800D|nr:hypothetical protein [Methylobacterium sp. J-068]MCJ2035238.1 hypothetical protein [Methylobacterium sp. J-068]
METTRSRPLSAHVVSRANLFRIGDAVEIIRSSDRARFDWSGVKAEVRGVMVDEAGRVNIGLRNEWGNLDDAFAPENLLLLERRPDGQEASMRFDLAAKSARAPD